MVSPQTRARARRARAARLAIASCLAAAVAMPGFTAEPPFTVEQILSSPFPSGLVAAPSGGHVAWVFTDRGVRNVWIASPPEYRGRAVTTFSQDDGQEITQLVWSDDASRLAFTRGGPQNRASELPNPLSDPAGVERAVWVIELAQDTPQVVKLGDGASPLFLRDGSAVLFARQGKIFRRALPLVAPAPGQAAAAGGASAAPSPTPAPATPAEPALLQARGGVANLRLSPDGGKVLFVSARGRYSFVGVYDFASKRVDFLDPGVDQDLSPVFSPDGARVAFVRVPASMRTPIFEPQREGPPWSIRWWSSRPAWRASSSAPSRAAAVSFTLSSRRISSGGPPTGFCSSPGSAKAGRTCGRFRLAAGRPVC